MVIRLWGSRQSRRKISSSVLVDLDHGLELIDLQLKSQDFIPIPRLIIVLRRRGEDVVGVGPAVAKSLWLPCSRWGRELVESQEVSLHRSSEDRGCQSRRILLLRDLPRGEPHLRVRHLLLLLH